MRPRLAVLSDDLSSEFGDAARVAAGLGLDGLAVRHVGGRNIADLDRVAVQGVRRTADQFGLDIAAASSPLGRGLALDADPAAAMVLLDTMLGYADVLQTNLVRFFACWLTDHEAVQDWWDRPNLTAALPQLVDRVGAFAARAERAGVTLMLELEGASYAGQVAEAQALMAAVDSPSLALCWDVANGWWSGEHPSVGLKLALRMPLVDVQVKDLRARSDDPTRPDLTQVALGSGDIDYPAIIAALCEHDYAGWVTAERVYHPRRPEVDRSLQEAMVADLRRLRSLLN